MTNKDRIEKLREIAVECGVVLDRWGNIKWSVESPNKHLGSPKSEYRYHFKKNVMNRQAKIGKTWTRLGTSKIPDIKEDQWKIMMLKIVKDQLGV